MRILGQLFCTVLVVGCGAVDTGDALGDASGVSLARPGPCERLYDYDLDGAADQRITYTYDVHGNELTWETDRGADGTVDHRGAYTNTYDNKRRLSVWETDVGADGETDSRAFLAYDVDDNLVTVEQDQDADGNLDLRITQTYDDDGRILASESDGGLDGEVDSRWTYARQVVPSPAQVAAARAHRQARQLKLFGGAGQGRWVPRTELLRHVFGRDAGRCRVCGSGQLEVLAVVTRWDAITAVLDALGLSTEGRALVKNRGPPSQQMSLPLPDAHDAATADAA